MTGICLLQDVQISNEHQVSECCSECYQHGKSISDLDLAVSSRGSILLESRKLSCAYIFVFSATFALPVIRKPWRALERQIINSTWFLPRLLGSVGRQIRLHLRLEECPTNSVLLDKYIFVIRVSVLWKQQRKKSLDNVVGFLLKHTEAGWWDQAPPRATYLVRLCRACSCLILLLSCCLAKLQICHRIQLLVIYQ